MKLVSVIIPVYKAEKYIAATLQSVLDQTYQNFEILIVDDASPDKTVEICQQLADPRIKIIRQNNRGPSGALNAGIRQARGEYVAFLDGDDLWLPEKLAKHIEHLEGSRTLGVSFSRSAFIDEAGQLLGNYTMPKLKGITPLDLLRSNPLGNGSAAVVRRETLDAIKFQDDLYGSLEDCYFYERIRASQDIEWLMHIAVATPWEIEGLPEALTLYRIKPGGLSSDFSKIIENWEKVLDRMRSYAPDLIERYGNMSRSYQARYLARTTIRMQADGAVAVKLINRSLAIYWRILLEDPRSTILTGIAAYSLWIVPRSLYHQTEALISKLSGVFQRQRLLKDRSEQSV